MTEGTCSVEGCAKPVYRRGMCSMHESRLRKTGSLESSVRTGCVVEGCERKHFGHGLCSAHWQRWKRHGDPEHGGPVQTPVMMEERFWARVDKSGDCWLWTGKLDPAGYGRFAIGNRSALLAHRISYQIAHGAIPDGLCICHSCDNPPCVNPAHLWAGTMADNNRDKVAKGRARGPYAGEMCRRGLHPFDDVNTRWYRGKRSCRACHADAQRARRKRKREAR